MVLRRAMDSLPRALPVRFIGMTASACQRRWQRLAIAIGLLSGLVPSLAHAQTTVTGNDTGNINSSISTIFNQGFIKRTTPKPPVRQDKDDKRMLVEAHEMVYDKDKNTVSAVGEAQVYYQNKVLEADKVIYDRNAKRVYAEGHAKLTDENGAVTYGSRIELTDNFKDGFIDSLSTTNTDGTRMTSPRGERTNGDATVLEKGIYTACEPCKDDPSKPPLWQVRATRIIHDNNEHMIYYENATVEMFGMPVAWFPYMSQADPNKQWESGFLFPKFLINNANLGSGVSLPYYFALNPSYDLLYTPTYYTNQGLMNQFEWRQRFQNGAYNITGAGIFQTNPSVFGAGPTGPGTNRFRGSLETNGKFNINDKWSYGWNLAFMTDRWFYNNYRLNNYSLGNNFYQEATSQIYLNGQSDRGYFDIRGYDFKGLSSYDFQKQSALIRPTVDYNKQVDLNKAQSFGLGGTATFDMNILSLQRDSAAYLATGPISRDQSFNLYNTCNQQINVAPGQITPLNRQYYPGKCLLQGVGGDYSRISAQVSWQRKFVDPIGEVWTPFAFARLDGEQLKLNQSDTYSFIGNGKYDYISNLNQNAFLGGGSGDSLTGRAMPGVGVDYRYPFVARTEGLLTQSFTPIAQVIVRPNETNFSRQPNEDSQSLVFDDTNLFQWNKFTGYDREEGGGRLNYGGQYSAHFDKGGTFNATAGESIHLFGRNSFTTPDATNTAAGSGLDKKYSNYVTALQYLPSNFLSFSVKNQFEQSTFALKRTDVSVSTTLFNRLTSSVNYGRYAAQPLIGYNLRREGLSFGNSFRLTENYRIFNSINFDLSHYLAYQTGTTSSGLSARFTPTAYNIGLGYMDECAAFNIIYSYGVSEPGNGTKTHSKAIYFQLKLRTLGEVREGYGFTPTTIDGAGGVLNSQAY